MTEFHVLTEPELRPILDLLTSLPEHTLLDELPGIADRLGRTLQTKGIGQMNLPVSFRLFDAGGLDNKYGEKELSNVYFRVTDALPDYSAASQRAAALSGLAAAVTDCLGVDATIQSMRGPMRWPGPEVIFSASRTH
ncbi:MAG: hypothetical protein LBK42_11280 [Propionibacteriaceae bacterium]|nr:hypothetical protein [Propionibacteriaceae bacterium]